MCASVCTTGSGCGRKQSERWYSNSTSITHTTGVICPEQHTSNNLSLSMAIVCRNMTTFHGITLTSDVTIF